jgi:hypothetical protein
MRFRFILTHPESGQSEEITEPDGWKSAVLKLDRHDDFHSLIEYFEGSFIFYGNNGVLNGGITFIKSIIADYGLDTTIVIDIDLTFDDETYSQVFNGQLGIADLEEMPNNKMRIPIIRDDFWAKFISRLDTPVNVLSTTDLDETPIDRYEQINLELPSQKIRYEGSYEWGDSYTYYGETGKFGMQLDWEIVHLDDLKKFTLPRANFDLGSVSGVVDPEVLIGNFEAPYSGDYTLDIQLYASEYFSGSNLWDANSIFLNFHVLKTSETAQSSLSAFDKEEIVCGSDSIGRYTFNKTITLSRGEQVTIYGRKSGASDNFTVFGNRLTWHTVALATNASVALTGEQSIDGTLTSSTTVLVKNQSDPAENGIYITSAGAWTRATYSDIASELNNVAVFVSGGTSNIDTAWKQLNTLTSLLDAQSWTYIIPSDERFKEIPCDFEIESYLRITADTISSRSESEGLLIHDVAASISDRIIGQPSTFYSELFGSSETKNRQYFEDGCEWAYALVKGLQLRQYTLDEKPFFMSFKQWWLGANPIFNLSLCYETVQIPSYITSSPEINLVQDLASWQNASGGLYPATTWDFVLLSRPFVSVNGAGGTEGYAVGTMTTEEGIAYTFDTIIDVSPATSETPVVTIVWGILDALFNEIITETFNYIGAGNKIETFTLIPPADGTYFGVRIINNTPTSTKNFDVQFVSGVTPTIVYDEENVIRVEEKAYQYDNSTGTSVDFSNIRDITRKYDNDRIWNKTIIGYARWQAEDISGIDDPQTKKTYATRFQKVGKEIQILSEFIGASLAIETTRRKTREKSSDYKFDNETFIIAINPLEQADTSPDTSPDYADYIPELDENFSSITGLLNSETRYNIKLTAGRNFLRWQNYLQGPLQDYLGSNFKFVGGEGNYDMTSVMDVNGCLNEDFSGSELDEKGDIIVTDDFIHLPHLYEANFPMEWNEYVLVRNNKRKPIGISLTDTDHKPMFIKTMSYKPVEGTVNVLMWAKEYLDLSVFPDTTPMQECQPSSDACENALTDSFGNILTDELGVCITE